MATIRTPDINRIFRMTEYDLARTSIKQNNMYMCLDSKVLYYDATPNSRVMYNYVGIDTLNDMNYKVTPVIGTTYYVWEDNSLWLWNNKWISLWTTNSFPSAYNYENWNQNTGELESVYRYGDPLIPADDNGLLKDGSVVVRDRQRIIKGKIYVDDDNDNFIISSFLGGGLRLLPNGLLSSKGELLLNDEGALVRGKIRTINNEMYVDYREDPELDDNEFANTTHLYKVYHEGNLDSSAIKVLSGDDIYNKLLDGTTPSELDLNVSRLGNKTIDEISLVGHTHTASDISNFTQSARQQAEIATKTIFNTMQGQGVTVDYNTSTSVFTMQANNFSIGFTGGATGTAYINRLTDTTVNLVVDGERHTHPTLETRLDTLEAQMLIVNSMDPGDYYVKSTIDSKLAVITGTAVPTSGKPLLVDANLNLPTNATSASKLNHNINIVLDGNVQGSATLNTANNSVTINTTLQSYTTLIGDNTNTTYTVTHNLNSTNIIVQFRDTSTNEELHLANVIRDANTIQVTSNNVILSQAVKVLILKV